jgi:hypothetical protein
VDTVLAARHFRYPGDGNRAGDSRPGPHGTVAAVVCGARPQEGRSMDSTDEETITSTEENKAITFREEREK